MKILQFKSCNHGCMAKKASGQAGNGRCKFPNLNRLSGEAKDMMINHPDSYMQKFAEKVVYLIEHIEQVDEESNQSLKTTPEIRGLWTSHNASTKL